MCTPGARAFRRLVVGRAPLGGCKAVARDPEQANIGEKIHSHHPSPIRFSTPRSTAPITATRQAARIAVAKSADQICTVCP